MVGLPTCAHSVQPAGSVAWSLALLLPDPSHVPAFILPILDIPYTLTGKKVEVAVKRIISGEDPKVLPATLANPEALSHYYTIPELALSS